MSFKCRKCVICNKQENRCRDENIFFASFPLEDRRCKEWVRAVGNPELVFLPIEKLHKVRFVCGNHFDSKSFNLKGNRLTKTAIPSLKLLLPPLTEEQLVEFPLHVQSYEKGSSTSRQPQLSLDHVYYTKKEKVLQSPDRKKIFGSENHEQPTIKIHSDHTYYDSKGLLSEIAWSTETDHTYSEPPVESDHTYHKRSLSDPVYSQPRQIARQAVDVSSTYQDPALPSTSKEIFQVHSEDMKCVGEAKLTPVRKPTLSTTTTTSNATANTTQRSGEREHEHPDAKHLSPSTSQRPSDIQLSSVSSLALTDNQTQHSVDAQQKPSEEIKQSFNESQLRILNIQSYAGTNEAVEETVVDDYVQDDVLPAAEPPPEGGPFSWQRSSIPVPCDAGTDGVIDLEEEPEVFMYEDGGAPARGAADKGAGEVETEYDLEHHYKCNSCDTLISGPRYTCVQCADYDMCGACDARGAHAFHYVLRVPQHRPHGELQAVLQTIRRVLLSDGVIQLDDARVKSEVKEELPDPIAVELVAEAPDGDARGRGEDASDTEAESQARTDTEAESQARTDTEEDVTDDDATWAPDDDAMWAPHDDATWAPHDDATWAPQSPPRERDSPRRPRTRTANLNRATVMLQVLLPETETVTDQPHATTAINEKPPSTLKVVSTLQKVNPSMLQFGTAKRKLNAVGPGTPGNAKVRVLNPSEVSYVDMARATAPAHAARVAGASDGRTLERAGLVEPDGTAVKVKQARVSVTRLRAEQMHPATHKS